jgi:FKBP-type peptidyl-prolyl cis-trans isomerase 2
VNIENGKRVRIQIKLQVVGGDVIEESVAEYFQGAGTIIPGLERALVGLGPGAERKGVLPAKEAFGSVANLPTKKLPRAEFPRSVKLEIGATFQAKGPQGQDVTFRVTSIDDKAVEVRFVHPLADKDIAYEAKVLSVTDPVPPPLPADAIARDAE